MRKFLDRFLDSILVRHDRGGAVPWTEMEGQARANYSFAERYWASLTRTRTTYPAKGSLNATATPVTEIIAPDEKPAEHVPSFSQPSITAVLPGGRFQQGDQAGSHAAEKISSFGHSNRRYRPFLTRIQDRLVRAENGVTPPMSKKHAVVWLVLGLPVATVDTWLSIQAAFGLFGPDSLLGYATAVITGGFLTSFAVLAEVLGIRREPIGFLTWVAFFLVDMSADALCAVWYGQLGHPFSARIRLSEIRFDLGNWWITLVYLMFIVLAAIGCIQLSRAFAVLREQV